MTYIAAFRCAAGIVLAADTQETVEDEKQYCEKLAIPDSGNYPIAVGGAGIDEIVDAFTQEILESIKATAPQTIAELRKAIQAAIVKVYAEDVPLSVIPRQYRAPEFIVAAKPPRDDFVIFRLKGKRVYNAGRFVIIGYATASNYALLRRMYRESLSLAQGVLLGAYLVAHSKKLNEGVGFDTRIVALASHGAFLEDARYVARLEERAEGFLRAVDDLFLTATDVTIRDAEFDKHLSKLAELIRKNRQEYRIETSISLFETVSDPAWQGDAYAKLVENATLTNVPSSRTIVFREGRPWLMVPDGKTEDGREKWRLMDLKSEEAQGRTSFEPEKE